MGLVTVQELSQAQNLKSALHAKGQGFIQLDKECLLCKVPVSLVEAKERRLLHLAQFVRQLVFK